MLTECLLFYRTNLRVACNGFDNAIVTQNNTPIGSNIVYSGEKRTLQVNKDLFDLFLKVGSFSFMETVCAASLISSLVLLCFIWLTQWLFRNFSIFLYLQLNSLLLLKWAFGDNFVCAVLTWKSVNSIIFFFYLNWFSWVLHVYMVYIVFITKYIAQNLHY